MRIFVSGAGGFVGQNLIPVLSEKLGRNVLIYAIDKNPKGLDFLKRRIRKRNVEYHVYDLSDKGDWIELLEKSDIIISLHAQIKSKKFEDYWKNNVKATKNICEEVDGKKKYLIYASSSVTLTNNKDWYTVTKKVGEDIVKKCRVKKLILKPTLMYGKYDYKHLSYITHLMKKYHVIPVPGNGKYVRQPLFVEDFINIILNSIRKKIKGEYVIAGKESVYYIDLLKLISKQVGTKTVFLNIPIVIFKILMKIYGFVLTPPFVPQQLDSLISSDIFPVINWEKIFDVKYTSLEKGLRSLKEKYSYYSYNK